MEPLGGREGVGLGVEGRPIWEYRLFTAQGGR